MRTALIILVALLIVSATISIAVILVGSFDDTELSILATSGVLSGYTALMMPSLVHIEGGRNSLLTRFAITSTSVTLIMVLLLIWGGDPIEGEAYLKGLASVAVLAIATNHA